MIPARRVVAASPEACWDLLVSLDRWPDWGPSVRAAEPAGGRVRAGLRGRVHTALGVWVPFEITAFEPLRGGVGAWSWRVAGVPATTHTVRPHPAGATVTFGVPTWAAPYALVCQAALARIARRVEASPGAGG